MKKYLAIIFLALCATVSIAQRPSGGARSGGERPQMTLKGIVQDLDSALPLEFATLSLFNSSDSTLVSGALTEAGGIFELTLPMGRYYGLVEFIGYENKLIDITFDREAISANRGVVDLGTINLTNGAIQLDGVEITAERSETIMALDKRIFNVGQDLANRGGTAEDILDNVPSVTVDIDGAVSLRGSTGVRILINGRPSGLAGADNANGLRSIPSNLIERVEVITNPGARYEAEGAAGIINIVLKKEQQSGFNGSFDVNTGFPAQAGVSANINYRKGNINWFANVGVQYRESEGGGSSFLESQGESETFFQEIIQDRTRTGLSNSFRGGIDYYLSDKENLTGSFLYRRSDENNFATLDYFDYIDAFPGNLTTETVRTDDEKEDESNLEYSVTYHKEYSSRGHKLEATVQYRDEIETEGSDFFETSNAIVGENIPDIIQQSNNAESEKTWLFQLDFVKPINDEGQFEIGARSNIRRINNDYTVEELRDDIFMSLPELTNNFNYDEDIHAVYSIFGDKIGKFSYQGGLRYEFSSVLTELITTNEVNDRTYSNLFPSAFLNYELSPGNSLQVSYSRRIRRPRFWDLNPFFTFSDSRNTFSGNPNLDPELTDSYELNHIKIWNSFTVTSGLFYRHTSDAIQRILEFNEDGTTNRLPQNLATRDDYGVELTFAYSGLEWLRLDGNFNAFRTQVDGGNINDSFSADDITWFARSTARFTFWNKSNLQLRFNYRAPVQTTQGFRQGIASLDFGFNKDLTQDLSLTFSVRDVFNSRRRRSETFGEGFFRASEFQWRARTFNLSFNYRINQKKKRQRGGGARDFDGGGEF